MAFSPAEGSDHTFWTPMTIIMMPVPSVWGGGHFYSKLCAVGRGGDANCAESSSNFEPTPQNTYASSEWIIENGDKGVLTGQYTNKVRYIIYLLNFYSNLPQINP